MVQNKWQLAGKGRTDKATLRHHEMINFASPKQWLYLTWFMYLEGYAGKSSLQMIYVKTI